MSLIIKSSTQSPCRLKKVQGKKKRDAATAEAAKVKAEAADEIGGEIETEGAPPTTKSKGDLLNNKDEDVIF